MGLEIVLLVVPNYFLLQEGVTERRELPLLEAVQINWLLCPFPHYNGVVFLPTSVACCGVSLKTHGPCVTAVGIHISQLQTLGLGTRQCSKGLENSGSPGCRSLLGTLGSVGQMPRESGADVPNESLGAQGCPSALQSWILESQDLSAQQVIKPNTAVAASLWSLR